MSVYDNCLSGMLGANTGLKYVSNNMANMQNPGYKGLRANYESMGSFSNQFLGGNGLTINGESIDFQQGQISQTGSDTHLAINGEGFFIIKLPNGQTHYTRDGQFFFNSKGVLCDPKTGGYVQGYDKQGRLTTIMQKGSETMPGRISTIVNFGGKLIYDKNKKTSIESDLPGKDLDVFLLGEGDVQIHGEDGKVKSLHIKFTTKTGESPKTGLGLEGYLFITGDDGIEKKFDIKLDNGHLETGTFELNIGKNNHIVTLDFGNETGGGIEYEDTGGSYIDAKIEVKKDDGYNVGHQRAIAFNEKGEVVYLYDNEQKQVGNALALAYFSQPNIELSSTSGNHFLAHENAKVHLGRANSGRLGEIKAQSLEMSNINSTQEFANIIILQRMFQACSQLMDIDKKLIDEMYKK